MFKLFTKNELGKTENILSLAKVNHANTIINWNNQQTEAQWKTTNKSHH